MSIGSRESRLNWMYILHTYVCVYYCVMSKVWMYLYCIVVYVILFCLLDWMYIVHMMSLRLNAAVDYSYGALPPMYKVLSHFTTYNIYIYIYILYVCSCMLSKGVECTIYHCWDEKADFARLRFVPIMDVIKILLGPQGNA